MSRWAEWALPLIAGAVIAAVLYNFGDRDLLIGFTGCLSGCSAVIGIDGRDGTKLAVIEANSRGGIAGRRLKLLVRDNGLDPEKCVTAVSFLIKKGIKALVGPMRSFMAMAMLPRINAATVVIHAPAAGLTSLAVKNRILSPLGFFVLQGRIVFDHFGDIHRSHMMMTVRDGRFQPFAGTGL